MPVLLCPLRRGCHSAGSLVSRGAEPRSEPEPSVVFQGDHLGRRSSEVVIYQCYQRIALKIIEDLFSFFQCIIVSLFRWWLSLFCNFFEDWDWQTLRKITYQCKWSFIVLEVWVSKHQEKKWKEKRRVNLAVKWQLIASGVLLEEALMKWLRHVELTVTLGGVQSLESPWIFFLHAVGSICCFRGRARSQRWWLCAFCRMTGVVEVQSWRLLRLLPRPVPKSRSSFAEVFSSSESDSQDVCFSFLESRCLFCAMYNSNSSVDSITLNIQMTASAEMFFQHILLSTARQESK